MGRGRPARSLVTKSHTPWRNNIYSEGIVLGASKFTIMKAQVISNDLTEVKSIAQSNRNLNQSVVLHTILVAKLYIDSISMTLSFFI